MLKISLFCEKIVRKKKLKILPPPRFFFVEKNEMCLELPDLARKLIRIFVWTPIGVSNKNPRACACAIGGPPSKEVKEVKEVTEGVVLAL